MNGEDMIIWIIASLFVAGGMGSYLDDAAIGCITFGALLLLAFPVDFVFKRFKK